MQGGNPKQVADDLEGCEEQVSIQVSCCKLVNEKRHCGGGDGKVALYCDLISVDR